MISLKWKMIIFESVSYLLCLVSSVFILVCTSMHLFCKYFSNVYARRSHPLHRVYRSSVQLFFLSPDKSQFGASFNDVRYNLYPQSHSGDGFNVRLWHIFPVPPCHLRSLFNTTQCLPGRFIASRDFLSWVYLFFCEFDCAELVWWKMFITCFSIRTYKLYIYKGVFTGGMGFRFIFVMWMYTIL